MDGELGSGAERQNTVSTAQATCSLAPTTGSGFGKPGLKKTLSKKVLQEIFFRRDDGPAGGPRAGEQEWEQGVGKSCAQGGGR